jgi:uncharacterized protein
MVDFLRQAIVDFWATFAAMAPYLLFGFFTAGVLSMLVSRRMVERHLGGRGLLPLLKAAIFGVPLPLCSCGVIPVSMSLHKQGASKGSTISFLLSTPQTSVPSVLVTYSLLGPVFAVVRPLAAFATGMIGGGLVNLFGRQAAIGAVAADPAADCPTIPPLRTRFLDGMKYAFLTLPRDIGKPLLLGIVIAAIISVIVPEGFFAERLGRGLPAMLVMMAIGIPLYVCASASVPVAAALILKGLSPGAALVFLMTGPATNAAGLATIWNTLGRRTAILYLLTVAGCALAAGLVLDAIIFGINVPIVSDCHAMTPSLVQHGSAISLLAIMAYAFYTRPRRPKAA